MEDFINQKLLKMAEALGIDTKGKTELEIMALITADVNKEKTIVEEKSRQEFIDNAKNQLPNIKKQFEKPFEVWIEKVGAGKKPECLSVVGFNQKTNSVIVSKEGKLYQVEEKLIITSLKQLDDLNAKLKAERSEKAKKNNK